MVYCSIIFSLKLLLLIIILASIDISNIQVQHNIICLCFDWNIQLAFSKTENFAYISNQQIETLVNLSIAGLTNFDILSDRTKSLSEITSKMSIMPYLR